MQNQLHKTANYHRRIFDMDINIKRFNSTPLEYLREDQMRDIHTAALEILEDTGTIVHHDKALALLHSAGAHVKDGNRAYLPGGLVEKAIQSAPSRITIYNRNGNPAMYLEGRRVYYGTGSDCPNLLDSFSGERREFLSADVEDAVKLVDNLPYVDFVMSMGLAPDIPIELQYQKKYAIMIRNSIKPQVITAANKASLNDIIDIAAAVIGGREELSRKPLFVLYDEPTSPLVHTREALEKLLFMAENRLPINYSPGTMAGGTSPMTMAGSIAQANAEILTGLVIHQLQNPGAPFVFGAGMSPMDMQSMQPTYSSPEAMVEQAGLCQIGRCLYDLPTWGFGGCSASKLADGQAVNEATTYILMAGLMGTNLVHDVGYLEFGLTYSFDLLVMCDEFIGQVRRMMEGLQVDDEHLAVETIKRVGPGGHFLQDDHTFNHFRDNWQPDITDRRTHEIWAADGATTMEQRAKAKIKHILDTHVPQALTPEVDKEIDDILKRAKSQA
jgi:trimethylamine--corrinoid protein Co-methyltransferase